MDRKRHLKGSGLAVGCFENFSRMRRRYARSRRMMVLFQHGAGWHLIVVLRDTENSHVQIAPGLGVAWHGYLSGYEESKISSAHHSLTMHIFTYQPFQGFSLQGLFPTRHEARCLLYLSAREEYKRHKKDREEVEI